MQRTLSFAIPSFKAIGSDAHFQLLLVLHGAEAGVRQKFWQYLTMLWWCSPGVTIIIRLAPSCNVQLFTKNCSGWCWIEKLYCNHQIKWLSAEISAEGCKSQLQKIPKSNQPEERAQKWVASADCRLKKVRPSQGAALARRKHQAASACLQANYEEEQPKQTATSAATSMRGAVLASQVKNWTWVTNARRPQIHGIEFESSNWCHVVQACRA